MQSDESEREMLQSMLELTTEEEWDDLNATSRLELVKMKLEDSEDLSRDQVRWLIDEQNRAIDDITEAMGDMFDYVNPHLKSFTEAIQPWAELAEDNNAK